MKKSLVIVVSCLMASLLAAACHHRGSTTTVAADTTNYAAIATPAFCPDSAMAFAEAQIAFGPRTPGSAAANRCANYIMAQMSRWCDTVVAQPFNATLWDGRTARGTNIVASLKPSAPVRVLLAAHWDSRLWADHDPDNSLHHQPVPGANDGASGTALLMEMARAMAAMPPAVGVDFVFFDLEDQGTPEWADRYEDNTWCKGSQHWAQLPHTPFYTARYGILFDMVGTHQPRFTKEEVSRHYAPGLTNKVWRVAAALGHQQVFDDRNTDPILDDHLYINQIAGIPTIDIVQNSPDCSFFAHWHTTTDDLATLDPQTLATVAQVVMTTIYSDFAQ